MRDTRGVRASSPFTFDELPLHTPGPRSPSSSPRSHPLGFRTSYSTRYARFISMPLSPLLCYLTRHVAGGCAPGVRYFACEGPMLRNVHGSMSMPACQPPYFDRCYNIIRTWLRLVSRLWTYGVLHCT